jgi:aspartate aminotransferase
MAVARKIAGFLESASWIRRMFEQGIQLKKQFGEDNVFDLSLGNPVMEPPPELQRALIAAVGDATPGTHRYMPNAGLPEVRRAIARALSADCGAELGEQHVVMVCGAAAGLNIVFKTLFDPGDEVIVLSPFFVEYGFYADNHGGKAVPVATRPDFTPDMDAIRKAITPRTKALVVNSPNNPTGVVYSRACLRELADLLTAESRRLGRTIFLVSDDPYKKIVFDGLETPNIFEFYQDSIYITSHSKDLAVPGERIGYVAVHPQCRDAATLVEGMVFCNRVLGFVNAPALIQRAIKDVQSVTVDVEQYRRKRDLLYGELCRIGYSVVRPQGAFYMFPQSPLADEVEFIKLLTERRVLAVPGRGFGLPGFFRLSYCFDDRVIAGAIPGLESAFRAVGAGKG